MRGTALYTEGKARDGARKGERGRDKGALSDSK